MVIYIILSLLITYIIIQIFINEKEPTFILTKNNKLMNYNINKNGFNNVEHFYILNLKKNNFRRKKIIDIFNKINIRILVDNIFYACDGKNIMNSKKDLIDKNIIDKDFNYYFPIKPIYFNIWRSPGCLGHYISFYQIFQNAIFNNLEYFMIVEDDAIFNDNIKLFDYVDIMKKNSCDFLSLGQSYNFYKCNNQLLSSNKFVFNNDGYKFFKISDSNGLFQQTHTVIFRTEGIKKIIDDYFPMKCPTDVMLGNLCRDYETTIRNNILFQTSNCNQKLNGLFVYPPLSEQNNEYNSDISKPNYLIFFIISLIILLFLLYTF